MKKIINEMRRYRFNLQQFADDGDGGEGGQGDQGNAGSGDGNQIIGSAKSKQYRIPARAERKAETMGSAPTTMPR